MQIDRRSFFAALLAPILAKFLPKPRPCLTINRIDAFTQHIVERMRLANESEQKRRAEMLSDLKFMQGDRWPSSALDLQRQFNHINSMRMDQIEMNNFDPKRLPT